MKRLIIIISAIIIGGLYGGVVAQDRPPGYIGKRILINADATLSATYDLDMWFKYGASAQYILKKKFSMGAGYLFISKNVLTPSRSDNFYNYSAFDLYTHMVSVDFYFYNGIAPVGKYFKVSPFYMYNYSPNYYANGTLKEGNLDEYSAPNYAEEYATCNNWGLSILWGRQRIIKEIIVINYGVKLGVTLLNPLTQKFFSDDLETSESGSNMSFMEYVSEQNFVSTSISFHMSIGIIL
ncbi:MAG: hypothetical protein B6I18_05780 [Bacteroidetes bacterium 4572_112]|nr:MAG: hypothetical protein B6I18_05780 [Bacteroidetes bacterium 4572_112]